MKKVKRLGKSLKERDEFVLSKCKLTYPMQRTITNGNYDIFSFDGMNYATALTAVKNGWANPEETQNESPSIKEIMEFLKVNPSFTAIGYVVTPEREDTRISFEGVIATKEPSKKEYKAYVEMCRSADEFDNKFPYRAWYD